MSILLLVLGLLLFVGLVIVHEFGHFIAARRGGVGVEEFGIGFPPRAKILAHKKGTIYSINWLPLGGFVRLKGENDSSREKASYGAANLKTKVKIMLAGVSMNLVTAYILLVIAALVGLPKILPNQFTITNDTKTINQEVFIGYVEPDSPAAKAGLQVRDKILAFEGGPIKPEGCGDNELCVGIKTINSAEELPKITKQLAGQEVGIRYDRNGEFKVAQITLRTSEEVEASQQTDDPKGYLGIAPTEFVLRRSTWSAPIVAGGLIGQFTVETFRGIGSAIWGLIQGNGAKASEQVSGPVGVFVLLRDGSVLGFEFILFIIAVISLTLAIMNALPIPALDGGRLFVTLLFRTFKKPLTKDLEDKIHGVGFAVLMLLFLTITVIDIRRFF